MRRRASRAGFTIVELLVVIGVIGLLLSLLLPAVQQAREAARRAQCRNNLKQLALGVLAHESAHGRLPSNGWGYRWVGEPGRGTGKEQPGGWAYNLLPYLEQAALAEAGKGEPDAVRRETLGDLTETPVAVFRCPTRPGQPTAPQGLINVPYNAALRAFVARTDYACCEGDVITDSREGPRTLAEASTYPEWRDGSKATGVCFQRSAVRMSDLSDGASNTYLVGEKSVSRAGYDSAADPGHDQSLYSGVDWDVNRWVLDPPLPDSDYSDPRSFGGPHPGGCHMALCDGSVRAVSYAVDAETHRRLGNRRDGQVVAPPE